MEKYTIEIVPSVLKKDLPKIDKSIGGDIIRIILEKLTVAPLKYGAPLRHELQGYRKLKISKYRVVYKVENKKVLIISIGTRDKIYE